LLWLDAPMWGRMARSMRPHWLLCVTVPFSRSRSPGVTDPREGIRLHPGRYSSPGWAWGVRTARFRFRRVRRLLERD
jgi:hypothetical protein